MNAPGIAMEPPQYVLEELNEAPPAPTEEEYEADYAAAAAVAPPAAPSPYSFADDTPSSVADAAPAFDATEEPVAATGISSKFSDAAKVEGACLLGGGSVEPARRLGPLGRRRGGGADPGGRVPHARRRRGPRP